MLWLRGLICLFARLPLKEMHLYLDDIITITMDFQNIQNGLNIFANIMSVHVYNKDILKIKGYNFVIGPYFCAQ